MVLVLPRIACVLLSVITTNAFLQNGGKAHEIR